MTFFTHSSTHFPWHPKTLLNKPGASLPNLANPFSHFKKKRVGSLQILVTFPVKGFKSISEARAFKYPTPGSLRPQSQSITGEKPVLTHRVGFEMAVWNFEPIPLENFWILSIKAFMILTKKWIRGVPYPRWYPFMGTTFGLNHILFPHQGCTPWVGPLSR